MTLRPYSPTDAVKCRELLISNIPKYFVREDMKGLDNWMNALDTGTLPHTQAEAIYFYILELKKEIIGCAGFYLMKDENKAQLSWGIMHKDYHNKGYGKLLFDYRVNKIKEIAPGRQVTLWTSQHTFKYYEKRGMKVGSVTENGLKNGFDKYEMYCPS
jgi:N-acetylglutamate synthase-like GNAT family acetyltransferase